MPTILLTPFTMMCVHLNKIISRYPLETSPFDPTMGLRISAPSNAGLLALGVAERVGNGSTEGLRDESG